MSLVKTDVSNFVGVSRLYFNFLVSMDNDCPKVPEVTYTEDMQSASADLQRFGNIEI